MKLQKGNAHENNSRCDNFPNSPIREQTCLPGENSPSNNGQPYKLLRYMKYRHWTTDIPQSSYPLKKNCQNYEEIDDKLEAKTSLYFPIGGYEKGDPPNRNILTQLCTYFLSLLTVWTRICEFLYSDRLPPPGEIRCGYAFVGLIIIMGDDIDKKFQKTQYFIRHHFSNE